MAFGGSSRSPDIYKYTQSTLSSLLPSLPALDLDSYLDLTQI